MDGSLRGLASCKERPGDPYGAVPCAELLDVVRRQGKAMPISAALRIANDVLDGLEADASSPSRLEKREVSPRTMFVGPKGEAFLRDPPPPRDGEEVGSDAAGRLAYTAPEEVGGWAADERCELFSVGAVLYEMLAGKRIFTGADLESIIRNYEADLSAIAVPTARFPFELRLILASALAREPDERFQRARDFADAIRSFAQHARLSLDRAAVAAWLGSLDLWPARSGTFLRADLDDYSDVVADEIVVGEKRAR